MFNVSSVCLFFFVGYLLPKIQCFGFVPSMPSFCALKIAKTRPSHKRFQLLAEQTSHVDEQTPLCDLQTFLKLTSSIQSGGEAKAAIQGGQCYVNGEVEIRRAKKLFRGDEVFFDGLSLDVLDEVLKYGYQYKPKKKKIKPVAKIDENGNLEFGGRYRSEEWRAERKEKKAERKDKSSK